MSTPSGNGLEIDDPVFVQVGSNQLEGVVAYLGSVDFAEGTDWVGVRLTGSSVGKGKNNGDVQGRRYFEVSDENGGVFVKQKSVAKRVLTRLEELRLKRELKQQRSVASPLPSGTSKTTPIRSANKSPMAHPRASDVGDTPASIAARRKIVELRERRAATSTTPVPVSSRRSKPVSGDTITRTPPKSKEDIPVTPSVTKSSDVLSPKETPINSPASSVTSRLEEMKARSSSSSASVSTASVMTKKYSILLAKYEELENENKTLKTDIVRAEQSTEDALAKIKHQQLRLDEMSTKQGFDDGTNEKVTLQEQNDTLCQKIENLESNVNRLLSEKEAIEHNFSDSLKSIQEDLDEERRGRQDETKTFQEKLLEANKEIAILKSQAAATADQAASRASTDAESYKEKAKIQAEVSSLSRRVIELEKSLQESETALEELTLDKEQLLEEKDALEEKIEELNLDIEAARLEAEEAKVELEEATMNKGTYGGGISIADDINGTNEKGTSADTDDVLKSLSLQNSRLREAILRLREQSNIEKVELSSKLRVSEKDAVLGRQLIEEVENLRIKKTTLELENRELKETIDVNSAFEGMVEDLSDRIISLEDDNAALRQSIYELEEAAELATEMEEVQSEELKTLNKELESRDVKIINLEEAIKMQRRREDDFEKSLSNYRSSIQTLKEEKDSLLLTIEGASGEKTELVQASQKAMAQAAALVNNASKTKKLEISSNIDRLKAQSCELHARRLEEFLPEDFFSEMSSIKAEILLSDVASKASLVLGHILNNVVTHNEVDESPSAENDLLHRSTTSLKDLVVQSKIALLSSRISIAAQRFLHAMILLDEDDPEGINFSNRIIEIFSTCDGHLNSVLRMVLEDNVMESSATCLIEHLAYIQDIVVPVCIEEMPGIATGEAASVANTALRCCLKFLSLTTSTDVTSLRLKVVSSLKLAENYPEAISKKISDQAEMLLHKIFTDFVDVDILKGKDELLSLATLADSVHNEIQQVSSLIHEPNVLSSDEQVGVKLLIGNKFSWTKFIQCMQMLYPEQEWSFQVRAHTVRNRISDALENESKLEHLQSNLDETRKTLSTRNMELSMQTKRINELDSLLKQNSNSKQSIKVEKVSSASLELKEKENKMLTEAMEVLQSQVDEYEAQLRAFKDQPKRKSPSKTTSSRRSSAVFSMDDVFDSNINAEAAIFRPALRDALVEASKWRGKLVCDALSELSPLPSLNLPFPSASFSAQPQEGGAVESLPNTIDYSLSEYIEELNIATLSVRQAKANVMCVDLSKNDGRSCLREQRRNVLNATRRFEAACGEATSRLNQALHSERSMVGVL